MIRRDCEKTRRIDFMGLEYIEAIELEKRLSERFGVRCRVCCLLEFRPNTIETPFCPILKEKVDLDENCKVETHERRSIGREIYERKNRQSQVAGDQTEVEKSSKKRHKSSKRRK